MTKKMKKTQYNNKNEEKTKERKLTNNSTNEENTKEENLQTTTKMKKKLKKENLVTTQKNEENKNGSLCCLSTRAARQFFFVMSKKQKAKKPKWIKVVFSIIFCRSKMKKKRQKNKIRFHSLDEVSTANRTFNQPIRINILNIYFLLIALF